MGRARSPDPRGIHVEDRFVVSLAILGEDFLDLLVRFQACLEDRGLNHAPPTIGHHRTLQRRVGLQADDHIVIFTDVSGRESVHVSRDMGLHVINPPGALYRKVVALQGLPDVERLVGRSGQEGRISGIRCEIGEDEIADINLLGPESGLEALPRIFAKGVYRVIYYGSHGSPSAGHTKLAFSDDFEREPARPGHMPSAHQLLGLTTGGRGKFTRAPLTKLKSQWKIEAHFSNGTLLLASTGL